MSSPGKNGKSARPFRLRSATALVIANMIGAGIFTSTGFQAAELGHPGIIFLLWIVGGVLALCGALSYAELGAALPRAGGEYVYLRETYGGMLGFMSACVSLIAGFSAAVASAAKSFVAYLRHFAPDLLGEPGATQWAGIDLHDLVAVGMIWALVFIHMRSTRRGIGFNDFVTLFKVVGIVAILLATLALGRVETGNFTHVADGYRQLGPQDTLSAFATSLVFVMFCYSGWNASAYVVGEMKNPQRDLPKSLLLGTGAVLLLYLGLNAVYFAGASVEELAGRAEVGLVAAERLFGPTGVTLVTLVLCVSILASASAMTIAGPRVSVALGRDSRPFRFLSRTGGQDGTPRTALLLQGAVTTLLILSGRIDEIQQYAGFTLTLFAALAVSCVFVLRIRRPDLPRPFRTWGYPLTPALFLIVSGWMLIWALRGRPMESLAGLATVLLAGILYLLFGRRADQRRP